MTQEIHLNTNSMTLILTRGKDVIMRANAWDLILTAFLRTPGGFAGHLLMDDLLRESLLTAKIVFGGEDFVFNVPQPDDYKGPSQNQTVVR